MGTTVQQTHQHAQQYHSTNKSGPKHLLTQYHTKQFLPISISCIISCIHLPAKKQSADDGKHPFTKNCFNANYVFFSDGQQSFRNKHPTSTPMPRYQVEHLPPPPPALSLSGFHVVTQVSYITFDSVARAEQHNKNKKAEHRPTSAAAIVAGVCSKTKAIAKEPQACLPPL